MVSFLMTEEDDVFAHEFIEAKSNLGIARLSISVRRDFDPARDGLVLGFFLAHEVGHLAHAAVGGLRKAWDETWEKAFFSNWQRAEVLRIVEKLMEEKTAKFSPGFSGDEKKLRSLMERMEKEVLIREEAAKLRRGIIELVRKLDGIESHLRVFDRTYYRAYEIRKMLRTEFYPPVENYIYRAGRTRGDRRLFAAKWAVRRGVKRDELKKALDKSLDVESGRLTVRSLSLILT